MDQYHDSKTLVAVAPVVGTDNTAFTGISIDRSQHETVLFVIATGTLADVDATFAVKIEESADNSDWNDAASGDYYGDTSFTFASDSSTKKIEYKGAKRYCKVTITPSGNSGNAPVAAVAVLKGARKQPVG